jgi:transmembrane sensor
MSRIVDLRDAEDRRLAEAARWQLRLAEADIRTSPEFEAWLREPGNRAAWDQVSAPWDYFDRVAHDPQMIAAREAALGDAKRAGTPVETSRPFRPWAAAIAAALLVSLMGAGGYWWSNRPDDYRTAMGERRVVTLVDGSRLSLDSDSEVTVRYGSHARDLHLLRGQARFDVTHDRTRPFSVVAGKQKVIATGTAFNIDMAGPKVLVTLIEGRVLVVDENDGSATMPGAKPHVVELRVGQQMTTGTAAAPEIVPVNLQHVTAWTVGHIMFDDEPLSSVVERVNRYGGTQIVIADPQVGAMKISGVFNSGDVLGFVEIVTHYLPVRAVSEGTGTIALQSDVKKNGAL